LAGGQYALHLFKSLPSQIVSLQIQDLLKSRKKRVASANLPITRHQSTKKQHITKGQVPWSAECVVYLL
jgi:hypothetical protein